MKPIKPYNMTDADNLREWTGRTALAHSFNPRDLVEPRRVKGPGIVGLTLAMFATGFSLALLAAAFA